MSIDSQAITKIAELVQHASAQVSVQTAERALALPENFKLHNLEQFQDTRYRYRGLMTTSMLEEYTGFVRAESTEHAQEEAPAKCFVDLDNMAATTFFNLGNADDPGHGDHRARLVLEKTAPYKAMLGVIDKRLDQKQLAEFIEDWRDFLSATSEAGEALTVVQAIAAIRKITFEAKGESTHEQHSFRAKRTAMEEIETRAEATMPARLLFTCKPYQGLGEHTFNLRLSVITGEKPALTLRIVQMEFMQEQIAEDFQLRLAEAFTGERIDTYIGRYEP